MQFVYSILFVMCSYTGLMAYVIHGINYEARQKKRFEKEIDRYIRNLRTLSDEADIEYHLRQLKSIEELRRNNKRIEDAVSVYE